VSVIASSWKKRADSQFIIDREARKSCAFAGQYPNLIAKREDFHDGCMLAKRLECVDLAPAFALSTGNDSASKLDALQTLRAIPLRFCHAASLRQICPNLALNA
jgi:hypothetical protein